jgi:hypothetical protein
LPLVDRIEVSERTRSGKMIASYWPIMLPIDAPTRCAELVGRRHRYSEKSKFAASAANGFHSSLPATVFEPRPHLRRFLALFGHG